MDKSPPRFPSPIAGGHARTPVPTTTTSGPSQPAQGAVRIAPSDQALARPTAPPREDIDDAPALSTRFNRVVRDGKASGQVKRGREDASAGDHKGEASGPQHAFRMKPGFQAGRTAALQEAASEPHHHEVAQKALSQGLRSHRRAERVAAGAAYARALQADEIEGPAQARALRLALVERRYAAKGHAFTLATALSEVVRGMVQPGDAHDVQGYVRHLGDFASGIYLADEDNAPSSENAALLVAAVRDAAEPLEDAHRVKAYLLQRLLAPHDESDTVLSKDLDGAQIADIVRTLAVRPEDDRLTADTLALALLSGRIPLDRGELAAALAGLTGACNDSDVLHYLAMIESAPVSPGHKAAAAMAVARIAPKTGSCEIQPYGDVGDVLPMDAVATRERILHLAAPATRLTWEGWLSSLHPFQAQGRGQTDVVHTGAAFSSSNSSSSSRITPREDRG